MQKHFDQDLDGLKEKLLTMGLRAEEAVTHAIKALEERDDALALKVKTDDSVIDAFEIEIDEIAIHLLAKAPLASDLRLITVAMKISQNLERLADEATTIARRVLELNQEPPLKAYPDIPRLADLALAMLKDALDGFVDRNPEKARTVILRDKEVDSIHKQFQRELANLIIEDPKTISPCLNLMVISKCIERIADHATNIAEEVVYLYEGRDIRHGRSG